MERKLLTLVLIHQHPRILLGMKKRGFGAGRWNGFGGKVAAGETIEEAACREVEEEAGIVLKKIEKRGIVEFEFEGKPGVLEVHIFWSDDFSGDPREGEEMKPEWFYIDQIPFKEMWPDDIHWFPLFMKGNLFRGRFLFGAEDFILEKTLHEVDAF